MLIAHVTFHTPAADRSRALDALRAPEELTFDHHYLLYATAGALRLEADGQRWLLAPARAALITAGSPIHVALHQKVTACSVLFSPEQYGPPP